MDKDEIYSFFKGMELLKREGIKIHGIDRDEDFGWSTTSVQYPPFKREHYKGKMIKVGWHCHGRGKTPYEAIKSMIRQIQKYELKS